MRRTFWIALMMPLLATTAAHAAEPVSVPNDAFGVGNPRCELAVEPLGIDVPRPRLSWQIISGERGQKQVAYRVLVASTPQALAEDRGDLWDSGRVESDQTAYVRYDGKRLESSQIAYWKVHVWGLNGREASSPPATWTMGLLQPNEWRGQWIVAPYESDSLLLRKQFTVKPGLRRALVHVTGMGHYELSFNGAKAGNHLLSPGWTDYNNTILYDTHEVTHLLREGDNAAGMILGNGMYHVVRRNRFAKFTGSFGPLRAIVHLRLEYEDGSVEFVGSDDSWRIDRGPITYSSIYGGEDHDARLEPAGWNQPGFDDRAWRRAALQVRPSGNLRGHSAAAEPVRAIERRKPVSVKTFPDGSMVYDFGQNASFMPEFRVTGPAGSTVRLTPAEVANPDGTIYRATMGSAARGSSWWQYTKATDGPETWFPRFYYLGSRYVRADFMPPGEDMPLNSAGADPSTLPRIESIEAVIVHSSAAPAGEFSTSSELLNRVRDLVRWSMRSNMVSIFTDCPHREKLGWLEQIHLNGPAIRYEFDLARLFGKSMRDMSEAQTAEGLIPNIAPEYTEFRGTFRAAAEWGAAYIAVPWQQYQFTGDRDLLEAHYRNMKRYFAYLQQRAENDILSEGLGDWYDLGPNKPGASQLTPPPVTATAMYHQDALLLSRMAKLIGRSDDAEQYASHATRIAERYRREFFKPDTGVWGTDSQSSYAIPLAMGLVEPEHRDAALAKLIKLIESNGYGTTSGNVGFRYLLRALADAGRSDVIYRMVTQDEKPGYAYQLKRGETSLTESWDANLGSSHNHFMFGQVIEWFYHDLLGIQPDPDGPGFKKIILNPQPVDELEWAEGSYDSIHGKIAVRWEQSTGKFVLKATIPPNTTATLLLPARSDGRLLESGEPIEQSAGVKLVRHEAGRAVLQLESGRYSFESQR